MNVYLILFRRDGSSRLWVCVEASDWPVPCRAVQRPLSGTWASTFPPTEPWEPAAPSATVHPLLPKLAEGENQRKCYWCVEIVINATHTHCGLVRTTCFISVAAALSMGQPGSGGWLCGSAALSGDSWNCSGAAPHSARPALSLCHTGPAAQVHAHIRYILAKKCPDWFASIIFFLSHWLCVHVLQVNMFAHLWARRARPPVTGCISEPLLPRAFPLPAARGSRLR